MTAFAFTPENSLSCPSRHAFDFLRLVHGGARLGGGSGSEGVVAQEIARPPPDKTPEPDVAGELRPGDGRATRALADFLVSIWMRRHKYID